MIIPQENEFRMKDIKCFFNISRENKKTINFSSN